MQPRKISIDSFNLFLEFIKDFAQRNPNLNYDFLNPINIINIERESNKYQNMSYFWLKPHLATLGKAKHSTQNRSCTDLSDQVKGLTISNLFNVYQNYVGQLNDTKHNVFSTLLSVYPEHRTKIENVHRKWEMRSHFSLVPSDQFEIVISILNNFSEYVNLVTENLGKDRFIDLLRMIHALKHFIRDQKELLSIAMLSRLTLAKNNLLDDVVLITVEELVGLGLDKKYAEVIRDKMPRHMLSPELCYSFSTFIKNNARLNEKSELCKLYQSFNYMPHNMPIISDEQISRNVKKISLHLENTRLCSIVQVGAQFSKCYFTGSDFFSTDFRLAIFKNSCFRKSDFTNTNFEGASFPDCDLQWSHGVKTIFNYSDLRNTLFHGADFFAGQFQQATLNNTDFRLAQLKYSNFDNAIGSGNFDGADLSDSSFIGTDLSKMSFDAANLERVKFFSALTIHNIKQTLITFSKHIENHKNQDILRTAAVKDIINQVMLMTNSNEAIKMIDIADKYLIDNKRFMPSYMTSTITSISMFMNTEDIESVSKKNDSMLLQKAKEEMTKKIKSQETNNSVSRAQAFS